VGTNARSAGVAIPEVAIFDSPDANAFATGARRNAALVAVSTGLLRGMKPNEVDAVLGHEIGHVANGDMVTLALIQGVVNTFVFFFSRVIGHFVDRVVFRTERGYGPAYYVTALVAQLVLGILASAVVMAFSRQREFRADAGGARLSGRSNMIAALRRLEAGAADAAPLPDALHAFGISGGAHRNWAEIFSSHPPLAKRIRVLEGHAA
jgi:heat shock protein HtpX